MIYYESQSLVICQIDGISQNQAMVYAQFVNS